MGRLTTQDDEPSHAFDDLEVQVRLGPGGRREHSHALEPQSADAQPVSDHPEVGRVI